nr:orf-x2 [Xenopus tropicalis]
MSCMSGSQEVATFDPIAWKNSSRTKARTSLASGLYWTLAWRKGWFKILCDCCGHIQWTSTSISNKKCRSKNNSKIDATANTTLWNASRSTVR